MLEYVPLEGDAGWDIYYISVAQECVILCLQLHLSLCENTLWGVG